MDQALNQKIDAYIAQNKEQLLKDIAALVAVNSVEGTPEEGAPFGAGPRAALDKTLELAAGMGFATRNCENYIGYAELAGKDPEKYLATICHVDVVPVGNGWTADPFTMRIQDGWLLGRGVADDKGPMVATLYALKFLKEQGYELRYPIRALAGTNEETHMQDVDYYLKNYPAPAFCFTPDAEFPVCNGEKGLFGAKIVSPVCNGVIVEIEGGVANNAVPDRASALVRTDISKLKNAPNITLEPDGDGVRIRGWGKSGRDLFDTKLMGVLTPRPSIVRANFEERYESEGPQAATDWFYKFSQDTDYIRRYRIKRDLKWVTKTPYGDLDITINLSKPEKDPKAIAAAKLAPQSAYPKCQLCAENEGYAGRMNHPARENHRIIPLTINDSAWNLQYSPYVYYNEHCIVFNNQHTPMKIERATFRKLLDFVGLFPHYFVGSNADLPIVGGSILSHDHFQGGHYEFAMAKAPVEKKWVFPGFEDVDAGIVHWPMSCIRLTSEDDARLVELADKILTAWRGYSDEKCFIFAETDGEPHNTLTPIARMRDGKYQLDLVLRNNITTPEHPLGVFHPHAKLHHIKKENIGLIEVMGLAVLPSRLKKELFELADALVARTPVSQYPEELQKHAEWAEDILARHPELNGDTVHLILQNEVGHVFAQVLADAGVYKMDEAGRAGFVRFLASVQ